MTRFSRESIGGLHCIQQARRVIGFVTQVLAQLPPGMDPSPSSFETTNVDPPKSFGEALASMQKTVFQVWTDFIRQSPLIIAGIVVILLTWGIAHLASRLLLQGLNRARMRRSLQDLLAQLLYVGIWVVGVVVAAVIMFPGLTPTKALGGLGVISLAVSFAFKDIFENFFAGIMILWRFPFEPGDFIECEGIKGRIVNITIRVTTIRKVTDELVVVPNSLLYTNPVDVLTNKQRRRMTIVAGVAYDVDVPTAVDVIQKAVKRCESVSPQHDIQVFPKEFGESSMNIEVAWWCGSSPLEQRRSRGEVVTAIKQDLDAAGLEIPFPYRTLTFKEPLPITDKRVASGTEESSSSSEKLPSPMERSQES